MRFSSGTRSVDVTLAARHVPFAEYDKGGDIGRDLSCYIGVTAGQYLQIHITFSGDWQRTRVDILLDGVLCRIVSMAGERQTMRKHVDQVWLRVRDRMNYGYMTFETLTSSQDRSSSTTIDKEALRNVLTQSVDQQITVSIYPDADGSHYVPLPNILDEEPHHIAAVLTSSDYVATESDAGRTHRIRLLDIGGPPKPIPLRYDNDYRRGTAPFATFNFHYRDLKLLKQLDLPVSTETSSVRLGGFKRTYEVFQEHHDDVQQSHPGSNDVTLENSLHDTSLAKRPHYDEHILRAHDGYGPGSFYRQCESRSRRSIDTEVPWGTTSSGSNTIPISSRRTSYLRHSSPVCQEPRQRDSHSPLTRVMPTALTIPAAFKAVDPRITLSTHGQSRGHKQSDSVLETPRSPPAQSPASSAVSETQPTVFPEMSQELYEARLSTVAIPVEFIEMNPTNRKIMPMAMLRIMLEEDRKERERLKKTSGRAH